MTRLPLIALLIVMPGVVAALCGNVLPSADPCGATGFAGLVWQAGKIAEMIVLDPPMRVIRPGDAVTRDYLLVRINFELDDSGTIARTCCG